MTIISQDVNVSLVLSRLFKRNYAIMVIIYYRELNNKKSTVIHLSKESGLRTQNTYQVLRRLRKMGLVCRGAKVSVEGEMRSNYILTEKGKEELEVLLLILNGEL
ncbi:MAG: helix-turn-helix transcriptional regulator [Promethearchaeota archaeon]